MLDMIGIAFSSVMMIVIIVQAVRLDREQPWFQKATRPRPVTRRLVQRPGDKS